MLLIINIVTCDITPLTKDSNLFSSQKDYVCFDFVPQHHNIIRYRKGVAVIKDDFHTVCSWVQFKNEIEWNYKTLLG